MAIGQLDTRLADFKTADEKRAQILGQFIKDNEARFAREKEADWNKLVQNRQLDTWAEQDADKARKAYTDELMLKIGNMTGKERDAFITNELPKLGGADLGAIATLDRTMDRQDIADARQAATDAYNKKVRARQEQVWGQEDTTRENLAKYMQSVSSIPQTIQVPDTKAMKIYTDEKDRLESSIKVHEGIIQRLKDKNMPIDARMMNTYNTLKTDLAALKEPGPVSKELTKKEYLSEAMNRLKSLDIKDPKINKQIVDDLKTRVDLIYGDKKESGLTPYQQYQIEQKTLGAKEDEATAMSLGQEAFGAEGLKKILSENKNLTPAALKKLAEDKIQKKGSYKSGSILSDISKLVKDDDEDNQAAITANAEELKNILKTKFKNNKAEMVQAIEGYYNRQGTGALHNWFGGSPMGDALDNFISDYKK